MKGSPWRPRFQNGASHTACLIDRRYKSRAFFPRGFVTRSEDQVQQGANCSIGWSSEVRGRVPPRESGWALWFRLPLAAPARRACHADRACTADPGLPRSPLVHLRPTNGLARPVATLSPTRVTESSPRSQLPKTKNQPKRSMRIPRTSPSWRAPASNQRDLTNIKGLAAGRCHGKAGKAMQAGTLAGCDR